jgi:hypothetical protein
MAAVAKLQGERMLAGRQRQLRFSLRLTEMERSLAFLDYFAFCDRTAVNDQMVVSAIWRRIAGRFQRQTFEAEFDGKRVGDDSAILGSMKNTRGVSAPRRITPVAIINAAASPI